MAEQATSQVKQVRQSTSLTCCLLLRLIKAIHREEETGHPLKMMINDLGIPKASLNESSFDWPVRHNTVLKHATHFHTTTDHEASTLCSFGP